MSTIDLQGTPASSSPGVIDRGHPPAEPRPGTAPRAREVAGTGTDPDPAVSMLSISVPKGNTKTINVYVSLNSNSDVIFSATSGGTGYQGGVVFVTGDTSTLNTSWVLGTDITSLVSNTSGLSFGTATNNAQPLQLIPGSAGAGVASFTVNTSGGSVDPQIIVTPIGSS